MAQQQPRKKQLWLWGGIAAVLVIALIVAIASTSGSDATVNQGTVATNSSSSSAAETQPVSVATNRPSSSPAEAQPVTVTGADLPPMPDSGADPAIGMTAPTLAGYTFNGSPIDITPGGRAKMVVFLAHWCPHCNREIPVLQQWAAASLPTNLDIIGVSTGVSAQRDNYPPSKWIVEKGWKWPVLADSTNFDAANAYGLTAYPTFAIVGADGKVKVRSSGELPVAKLDAMVKQALAA